MSCFWVSVAIKCRLGCQEAGIFGDKLLPVPVALSDSLLFARPAIALEAICGPLRKIPSLELPIKDRSGKKKRLTKIPERVCQASGERLQSCETDQVLRASQRAGRLTKDVIDRATEGRQNRYRCQGDEHEQKSVFHQILSLLVPDELLYPLNHGFVLLCLDVLLDRP